MISHEGGIRQANKNMLLHFISRLPLPELDEWQMGFEILILLEGDHSDFNQVPALLQHQETLTN